MKNANPGRFLLGTLLLLMPFGFLFSQTEDSRSKTNVNLSSSNNEEKLKPAGFPEYINTGNKEQDDANYNTAKIQWIEKNPEKYNEMNNGTNIHLENVPTISSTNTQDQSSANNTQKVQIAGFPEYVNTGNKEQDDANYAIAKEKWIKENPEEYNKLNGSDTRKSESISSEKDETGDSKAILFEAIKTYQLIKVEAIAAEGMSPTNDELLAETENVKVDFPEKLTWLNIGLNNQIQLLVENRLDFRATEKRNFQLWEWSYENKKCESCSKTLYLIIEQETPEMFVLVMKGEDENAKFNFRLEFILKLKN